MLLIISSITQVTLPSKCRLKGQSRRCWFEFHLASNEWTPVPIIVAISEVTVEARVMTGLIPSCSSYDFSTVPTVLVIVPIWGGESHTVMIRKFIVSVTRIESNKQGIVGCLICHRKIAIFCVSISSQCGVDFHSQLTRDLSQLMNLFVSKPKLSSDVTKPVLVLVPDPLKSNEPIKAFVKDGPSTTIRRHVTVHFKTGFVCWVDCVHSTILETSSEELCAISG